MTQGNLAYRKLAIFVTKERRRVIYWSIYHQSHLCH